MTQKLLYAFDSKAAAMAAAPAIFEGQGDDAILVGGTMRGERGVWITPPVFDYSDPLSPTPVTPGVRSAPFVFYANDAIEGAGANLLDVDDQAIA